jgi:hypothetical protein
VEDQWARSSRVEQYMAERAVLLLGPARRTHVGATFAPARDPTFATSNPTRSMPKGVPDCRVTPRRGGVSAASSAKAALREIVVDHLIAIL